MIGKRMFKFEIIIIGAVLLFDAVVIFFISNFNTGLIPLTLYATALIVYGVLFDRLHKAKWLHILMSCGTFILVVFSVFLAAYGNSDNSNKNEDVVIVLGAGIRGEEVTVNLAGRLDKAAEYYAENKDAIVIVSGGQGKDESITEALAMERYLIQKGIPAEKIIKEDKSTSTYENFMFSAEILRQEFKDAPSVVFITNSYHVYRAEKYAESAGINTSHIGADTAWYTIPVNYMREMMAVVKLWCF